MLKITLPLPNKALSPNARCHWTVAARHKRTLRTMACLMAKQALGMEEPPLWKSARVQCTFFWPDKRVRDRDNAAASMKAAMDGFTDAKIWVDDSGVIPLPPVMAFDKLDPRVEVVIECEASRMIPAEVTP